MQLSWLKLIVAAIAVFCINDTDGVAIAITKSTLAIIPIANEDQHGIKITEAITAELAVSDHLSLIERRQLENALKAWNLRNPTQLNTQMAIQLGKHLHADNILTGTISTGHNEQLLITLSLYSSENGQISLNSTEYIQRTKLSEVCRQIANVVHKNIVNTSLPQFIDPSYVKSTQGKIDVLHGVDPTAYATSGSSLFIVDMRISGLEANNVIKSGKPISISYMVKARTVSESEYAYIALYYVDAKGRSSLLFPNSKQTDNKISIGKAYVLSTLENGSPIVLEGDGLHESIMAIVLDKPIEEHVSQEIIARRAEKAGIGQRAILEAIREKKASKYGASRITFTISR